MNELGEERLKGKYLLSFKGEDPQKTTDGRADWCADFGHLRLFGSVAAGRDLWLWLTRVASAPSDPDEAGD